MSSFLIPSSLQSKFELPKGVSIYNCNGRADAKELTEKMYGSLVRYINDASTYVSALVLDHLKKYNAELIEIQTTIVEKASAGQEDTMAMLMGEDSGCGLLYWYKGCFVRLTVKEITTTMEICGPMALDIGAIHNEFRNFLAPKKRAAVSILLQGTHGMTTKKVDFTPPVIDDLALNYGANFPDINKKIISKLEESKSGLMCFHGAAGCGKTTFIKYLTSKINREFIFIPVGLAGELSSPAFLTLLMNHPNAILVLEDAEQALQSRETDHWNSATIATLLNITDGILGTLLNITIIATYNADKQTIDKALLRKGRLALDYTFDKLSIEDAHKLAIHLKKDPNQFSGPTSLADIYNAEEETGYIEPVKKSMGFGFASATLKS